MATCERCGVELATNYVGKVLFLEASREGIEPQKYSGYYNGEYLIVRQSPCTLYGVKMVDDEYNGRQVKDFPLVGSNHWDIIESFTPKREDLIAHIERLWCNANRPERGEKLAWAASVYSEAKETARLLARIAGYSLGASAAVLSMPSDRVMAIEKRLTAIEEKHATLLLKLRAV